MNLANCPQCGKLYVANLRGMCGNCIKDIDHQYERCNQYLREHKGTTITELSEAVDVSIKQITTFIREGRISIANAPNMGYACEVCGTVIRENNMCEPCRTRLTKDIRNAYQDEEPAKESGSNSHGAYRIVDKYRNN
ncbi:TIGR03826 family flagellar region protein [Paenibacillus wulumuqiensis]|uniref:TIGR03826 family flagellar region protein n=1 Tax=Paenibacillus wulumuqiensis TaxID=1567107 RepID=UPI0006196001|nr:TIGR03826 family flagellar region protein [Paenibacillus wulumuqiensis]